MLKNPLPGVLHLIVFYGFIFTLFILLLAQTGLVFSNTVSVIISYVLDILGLLSAVAVLVFLIRRIFSSDIHGPQKSILPLLVLLLILATGFMAEGFRISITGTENIMKSPAGWIISVLLPPSPVLMHLMIRLHFLLVLFLFVIIPFTFFRHLITVPLNVLYRRNTPSGMIREIPESAETPGAGKPDEFTWKQLLDVEACVACGRCDENCPTCLSGKQLSPRNVMRQILNAAHQGNEMETGLPNITADEIWSCTGCMACVEACPVFASPLDKIIDMRRYSLSGKGKMPHEAAAMIRDLEIYGDTYGKGVSYREDWALNRGVHICDEKDEFFDILVWTGCSGAFHPRYQEVTRALVNILKKAGINFRVLGKNELCCGDPARRLGEENLFLELARKNLRTFEKYRLKKIVTLCPHCFNTIKNEYSDIKNEYHDFEVFHAVQYVMQLIEEKKIHPLYSVFNNITIHDPCYLGRGNNIYEPLRDVIKSIPETNVTELERSREKGLCCGGGGGGMWIHDSAGKRINVMRAEEISKSGADIVCTACPYCHTMLEDGINSLETDRHPGVMDIIEMVDRSLG
jgi:Fe-S oxidoreductase/nitrate reductase gamma subunit